MLIEVCVNWGIVIVVGYIQEEFRLRRILIYTKDGQGHSSALRESLVGFS